MLITSNIGKILAAAATLITAFMYLTSFARVDGPRSTLRYPKVAIEPLLEPTTKYVSSESVLESANGTPDEDRLMVRKLQATDENNVRILTGPIRPPSPEDLIRYSTSMKSLFASIPAAMDRVMANIWEPYDRSVDVPFYWQVPKAGTTNALSYLSLCLDLVEATRKGIYSTEPVRGIVVLIQGHCFADKLCYPENWRSLLIHSLGYYIPAVACSSPIYLKQELKVIEVNGYKYLNVDTTSPEGMDRANKLGLASSGLADVVVSGYVNAVHRLFTPANRGRLFVLCRHPIDRLASKFYYLQIATWEKTYRPEIAAMTIEEYAQSEWIGGNWMVRMLINKPHPDRPLTPEDLLMAKELMRRKCLVGLVAHMEESLQRFETYFGWSPKDVSRNGKVHLTGEECKRQYFGGERQVNAHKHPPVVPGSEAWDLLSKAAEYDMELYSYAVELFAAQRNLFGGEATS